MMFFVYNRVDTTQKSKLSTIIQSLSTSLNDAFDAVQNKIRPTGFISNSGQLKLVNPFRDFKLDASNSFESDVRILGNIKENYKAPADVPDLAYGETLVEFREHIHRRVTSPRGENSALQWKSRSLNEFANYLEAVCNCIGSANFTLHFASIMERYNFDRLEKEYKKCEQHLALTYQIQFREVQKYMIKERGEDNKFQTNSTETYSLSKFERSMQQVVDDEEGRLNDNFENIVAQKGREKWKPQYDERWIMYKQNQNNHWKGLLKSSFDTLFTYDSQVEKFKKDMRQKIRILFSTPTEKGKEWTRTEKLKEFEKMYEDLLTEAKPHFVPEIDVERQIKKVYQTNKYIIDGPILSLNNPSIEKECEYKIHLQLKVDSQCDNKIETYERDIFTYCRQNISSKVCYDDSIGDNIIRQTRSILNEFRKENIKDYNIHFERAHIYARTLAIIVLKKVQHEWNENYSIYAKLNQESNKSAMWDYFMKASEGVETTELFICQIQSILKNNLAEAFEIKMIYLTTYAIRNEKWLNNGKFMQNHIDLYLIELLEDDKLQEVLNLIANLQKLYREVLENLVASKVRKQEEEYQKFIEILKKEILQVINSLPSIGSGRAAYFVETLRNGCVTILSSPYLGEKLLINCGEEYEDCDKEDLDVFMKSCEKNLIPAVEAVQLPINNQGHFAKFISSKVVEFMKTQNDAIARPRCDASCPWCGSQCLDSTNHDTKFQLHDTIHQPSGLKGIINLRTNELWPAACSKYEDEQELYKNTIIKLGVFKDFETIFPGWKKPKWKESWPLREYIFTTYQEDIAKRYEVKVCREVPSDYKRELSTIRENLEKEIQNLEV